MWQAGAAVTGARKASCSRRSDVSDAELRICSFNLTCRIGILRYMNVNIEVTNAVSVCLIEAMLAKTVTRTAPHRENELLVEFADGSQILLDRVDAARSSALAAPN